MLCTNPSDDSHGEGSADRDGNADGNAGGNADGEAGADRDANAEELDCLTCGACCRQASDGRILVPEEDLLRWRRQGRTDLLDQLVPGHFSELAFAATSEGACVHLGTKDSPNACSIYADRGTTCREFERGSWQCREFRRDMGIDPPRQA